MTDVTVCITHVLREKLLEECLRNLKNNANYPFKTYLICVGERKPVIPDWIGRVEHNTNQGLGASRRKFADNVDTEFLMFLDNDVMMYPNGLKRLIHVMKEHPELGVLTSFIKLDNQKMRHRYIANIMIENKKTWKKFTSFDDVIKSKKALWYSDFTGFDHTLFRTRALRDIEYDSEYPIGYEHWDACLQLKLSTKWKLATLVEELFEHVTRFNTQDYNVIRYNAKRLNISKNHFIKKWGLEPVTAPW